MTAQTEFFDTESDDHISYAQSRAKRELHNANLAEIEELKKRGELVEVKQVQKEADRAARAGRDAFTALPERLASILVGRTEQEILTELRSEIRNTLERVSQSI